MILLTQSAPDARARCRASAKHHRNLPARPADAATASARDAERRETHGGVQCSERQCRRVRLRLYTLWHCLMTDPTLHSYVTRPCTRRHVNNKREVHLFQFHGVLQPDIDQETVWLRPSRPARCLLLRLITSILWQVRPYAQRYESYQSRSCSMKSTLGGVCWQR